MTNLKDETLQILAGHGKTADDVRWVGTTEYTIQLDNFWEKADVEYDAGFGGTEIFEDLIVVGDDFWLERHGCDGSEWWEYKTMPTKPTKARKVKTLKFNQWSATHHPYFIFEEQ